MPTLNADVLAEIRATYSGKVETTLKTATDPAYKAICLFDTFGSSGYAPGLRGGLGLGQEWVTTRLLRTIKEFGMRALGKRYENSAVIENTVLADSPILEASKIAADMAESAMATQEAQVYNVLSSNAVGFDGVALFADNHTYTDAVGADEYSNDITGAGAAWYLCNGKSIIVATREGEDFTPQMDASDEFETDAVKFGFRARKVYTPGFWANSVRSKATLNADNLQAAITLQRGFKNDTGTPIAARSTHLVCGPSNEAAARKVLEAMLVNGGDSNVMFNRLQLIVSDYLV